MGDRTQIQEFISALRLEVAAIKKGKGGGVTKVFNGRFIKDASGLFLYVFHLENFLATLSDDLPAEIEIKGRTYSCQIVSHEGLSVLVALEESCGNMISEASIQTNAWFLLELLAKKFEEFNVPGGFPLSNQLFNGVRKSLNTDIDVSISDTEHSLNQSQCNAIKASINSSMSIIWGPPGTGKTFTIAQLVKEHLKVGRKVLLVAHANAAVDQAMEHITKELKDTVQYQSGRLIRLGVCSKSDLPEKYPLVVVEKVAEKLGESLVSEKQKLLGQRDRANHLLSSYNDLIAAEEGIKALASKGKNAEKRLNTSIDKIQTAQGSKQNLELKLRRNKEQLANAINSGRLKRLLLALNPEKIASEIEFLKDQLSKTDLELMNLEQSRDGIKEEINNITSKRKVLTEELTEAYASRDLNFTQVQRLFSATRKEIEELDSRITEIDKVLDNLKSQVLARADLIATTLAKTYCSKEFPSTHFDAVIVDEVSMASLPALYWAVGKSHLTVTVVGDFKQLPPICVSREPLAVKWLKKNIFDLLEINTVRAACSDSRVTLLDTQRRMNPSIAKLASSLFYENLVKSHDSTKTNVKKDKFSGESPLILIDTSSVNPWCCKLSSGSYINIYNALMCIALAEQLLTEYPPPDDLGIVTPYRAQARLISKMAKDKMLSERLHIDTIHRFQGGEQSVMIFDCVEAPGKTRWSFLDDSQPDSNATLLLNVALTRAKCKVYMVAHKEYFSSFINPNTTIMKMLEAFGESLTVPALNVLDSFKARDFEKWATALTETPSFFEGIPEPKSLHTDKDFWPVFIKDLKSARNRIVIMSPFVTLGRSGKLMELFRKAVNNGVQLEIFTRPPSNQSGHLSEHSEQVISQLTKLGAKVTVRKGMHQKVALIDGEIAWEGSLNILSHKDTEEQMRRLQGKGTVKEIIENLDLNKNNAPGTMTDLKCPVCGELMVVRKGKYGLFLACSGYPHCNNTMPLPKNDTRPSQSQGKQDATGWSKSSKKQ